MITYVLFFWNCVSVATWTTTWKTKALAAPSHATHPPPTCHGQRSSPQVLQVERCRAEFDQKLWEVAIDQAWNHLKPLVMHSPATLGCNSFAITPWTPWSILNQTNAKSEQHFKTTSISWQPIAKKYNWPTLTSWAPLHEQLIFTSPGTWLRIIEQLHDKPHHRWSRKLYAAVAEGHGIDFGGNITHGHLRAGCIDSRKIWRQGSFSGTFFWTLLNLTWLCTKASRNLLCAKASQTFTGTFSGTFSGTLLNLTGFAPNPPRPSQEPSPEPSPEPCWTWPGSAPKPPRPSPEPSPEPCRTWPGSAPKPPRPSPEPSEPSPEPCWTWPGACTSAHRNYSGLKTPFYAVGEKLDDSVPKEKQEGVHQKRMEDNILKINDDEGWLLMNEEWGCECITANLWM